MDAQEPIRLRTNEKKSLKNSVTFRILIITVLALLLLIPSMMVQSLISERQSTSEETTNEVSSKWSYAQTVTGPVLNVPYQVWEKTSEKEGHYEKHTAHFLPENLKTSCELVPELRHRGIFDVVVYTAKIRFSGEFRAPDLSEWTSTPENISWDKVSLDLALSDLRGIENQAFIKFGNDSLYFEPGLNNTDFSEAGVSTKLVAQGAASLNRSFECELTLKGSNNIGFTPLGKLSSVEVSSTWPSPSFNGSFLPDSSVITDKGFVANWQVLHLNRNFPQQWTDGTDALHNSDFTVDFFVPADQYQQSMRTVKYAFMFIALTFILFFFVEVFNKKNIHPIQYLLVGLVLVMFFTLLISISEHLGFDWAYLISATAVVVLITVYVKAVLDSGKLSLITAGVLVILYGFIYITLQLEDYALLMGSIGLFVILAIIMIFSRKINWYEVAQNNQA